MPAFKVRRAGKIQEDLKQYAIVHGFSSLPVYTIIKKWLWQDDFSRVPCPFENKVNIYRKAHDYTYSNALWLRDAMEAKYKREFSRYVNTSSYFRGIFSYDDATTWSDALITMFVEDIPTKLNYTKQERYEIYNTELFKHADPLTKKLRTLFVSKILTKPLNEIVRIQKALNGEIDRLPSIKYMQYSSQTHVIAGMLQVFVPNLKIEWTQYASSIVFEVYKRNR